MGLASTFKALLRAVRRHRKLAAVAAATLLPVFLLSAVAVNFCARDISAAKTELTGTAYLRRSWSMVSACDARLPATEWSAVPLGPNVVPRPRLDAMGQALQVEMARVPIQTERMAAKEQETIMSGPSVPAVALSQDSVDDLLADLGF